MPDLPDAELEVLAALWRSPLSTAREVREALSSFRPMTHAAVFTLLKRLEDKGLVARRKGTTGKAFVYRARVRPERTYRRKVEQLLRRLFHGSSVTLVSSLFESNPPTEVEIAQLRSLLEKLSRRRREGGSP